MSEGDGTGGGVVGASAGIAPDDLPGGYLVYRAEGRGPILLANRGLLDLVGCPDRAALDQLASGTFEGLVCPDDMDSLRLDLAAQMATGPVAHLNYRLRTAAGGSVEVDTIHCLVDDPRMGPAFRVFVLEHDRRRDQAGVDRLTGLPQRDRLLGYVGHLTAMGEDGPTEPMTLAYLNIRGFRTFNVLVGRSRADQALMDEARLLREAFPGCYLARLEADRFVLVAPSATAVRGLEGVRSSLGATPEEGTLDLKVGLYQLQPGDIPAEALDRAMVACNSLSRSADAWCASWLPSMEASLDLDAFASLHIRGALNRGEVEVFYQPVVRALSGQLCGVEALARWRDPERGLIPPGAFIGALEESGQIVLLDTYVLERVCRELRERMDADRPVVPVSVNLSRLDFSLCDVPDLVEGAMEACDLPRDLLHVEVTESALAGDEGTVYHALEQLRALGYQVWMDDFGSGYSTLNLLKDYAFDTIKLDLKFLSTMDARSRTVVRHVVSMAKELGVDTLAEGVETAEQLAFLRDIGCDRIQGYYYGRPMSLADLVPHLVERGIERESLGWRSYRDAVGSVDFLTDVPLAIVEVRDCQMSVAFENKAFRQAIDEVGRSDLGAAVWVGPAGGAMTESFRSYTSSVVEAGGAECRRFYTLGGRYVRFTAALVATAHGQSALRVNLANLAEGEEARESHELDRVLRQTFRLYDYVSVIDLAGDFASPVYTGRPFPEMSEGNVSGLEAEARRFATAAVYVEDQGRYQEFCDIATLGRRVREAGGWIADYFRIRDLYGEYSWKVVTMLGVESEGQVGQVIALIKDADLDHGETARILMQSLVPEGAGEGGTGKIDSSLLWKNLMLQSKAKYFWKDSQRRFVGASKSFLDFYGIPSLDQLVGRTDEDMRWHVNDVPFRDEELAVLERGKASRDVLGSCIVRGQLHRILATKVPIYRNGRIVGLLGYFEDAEEEGQRRQGLWRASITDPVTGTFNLRGLWSAAGEYAEELRTHGSHFATILVRAGHYVRFVDDYGDRAGEMLLVAIATAIRDQVGTTATVGRVVDAGFLVLTRYVDEGEVRDVAEGLRQRISAIRSVGGNPCTVRPQVEVALDDVDMERTLRRLANLG